MMSRVIVRPPWTDAREGARMPRGPPSHEGTGRHTPQSGVTRRHRGREEATGAQPEMRSGGCSDAGALRDQRALERVSLAEADPVDVPEHDRVRATERRRRVRHVVLVAVPL